MIPINIYENTKIKIYSTSDGIKIVTSPIKIQILNMLTDKVSEADIVKETGKSKSTISVHLKNLLDERIISYKAHPLDRRSKLFYIYADYIGEIYPDNIIYALPEIEQDISKKEGLFIEIYRQFKGLLLHHGLDVSPLEIITGERIGKKTYDEFKAETLDELLDELKQRFLDLGLGDLSINITDDSLMFKLKECHECYNLEYNMATCNIVKGMLKGIFSAFYKKAVSVEEVECCSKYDDHCTFIVEK
ncbi:V4R domain-containing protein [Methanosphaera cuniculi]|uniref:V4R domain protein n=1 Tax=Methanosphaera cuniculi TaxID=1077256 RepID=A0A2A2HEC7_9EURY|nr:V4R domain-containing protein [Methanosphaera cuniculi]PAV07821.1 hypothetical protein ASJ82_02515 [Methanosphaera cuniculi]PWL07985.1 V4R domain protein [Methanosphaera cuniculi]